METPTARFWDVFFEVYEALPRQGPGSRAAAARALMSCHDLPPHPLVLDLGSGVGGQTLHLAQLTTGTIVALDNHAASIRRLKRTITDRGLDRRIHPVVGDMARPCVRAGTFDLVWSEGALYNIGIERALEICGTLLRPRGHLAFTDAVWRTAEAPDDVRRLFEHDYPDMGTAADVVARIGRCGFELLDRFALPDDAWWDDFYAPMEARLGELRRTYAADAEALAVLDQIAEEPRLHRINSEYYGYEFFVARQMT